MADPAEGTRQSDWVIPPMATAAGVPAMAALAVSTSAIVVDLTTLPVCPFVTSPGLALGHYIRINADGAEVGYVFGPTKASVTGANAPALGTVTAVDTNGNVTATAGACDSIPSGSFADFKLPIGPSTDGTSSPCRFLALVAAASGTARVFQSSI